MAYLSLCSPLIIPNGLVNMRGRHGEHDGACRLGRFAHAVAAPQAHGAQQGLGAAPLLRDVPRSRGEDLQLLPKEADGRSQPLGVVGKGEGNANGIGWSTRRGDRRRPFRVGACCVLHSILFVE